MTLKEALDSGYCSLEDDIDFDDTPQGEKIACLKLEIERLNTNWNELERYINEEYIYDELGMKIFDASALQDKLQELKGSE